MSNRNDSASLEHIISGRAGGMPSGAGARVEKVRGVFSTQEILRVGTGTTTRKTVKKTFWFVEQEDDNKAMSQPLNSNYVPSGPKKIITMEELLEKYAPEPEFYMNSVYPKMQELQRELDNADSHRAKGENFTAEYEYKVALKVDEENVRANFGIGLTYLQRGEANKAEDIFGRLVKLDAAFEEDHKHLFNDFGISLRKNKMYLQSVEYYERAIELNGEDENLRMNLARALFEIKQYDKCLDQLLKALSINPRHENSIKFVDWLKKKNLIPKERVLEVDVILGRETELSRRETEASALADSVAKTAAVRDAVAAKKATGQGF